MDQDLRRIARTGDEQGGEWDSGGSGFPQAVENLGKIPPFIILVSVQAKGPDSPAPSTDQPNWPIIPRTAQQYHPLIVCNYPACEGPQSPSL